jgi:hypothetical protein
MKLTTRTQITVDGVAESRTDTKGVTIQVYRPAGRPQYRPAPNPGS